MTLNLKQKLSKQADDSLPENSKIFRYIDSIKNGWRFHPPSLHVELTDRCLNSCIMCDHWKRRKKTKINLDNLIMFISEMKGLESICFTGGDPFCYPGLNDLMLWCQKNDVSYGIVTAGVPEQGFGDKHDQVDLQSLVKADWVRVSLDAVDNELYDKVRGGDISFSEVDMCVKKMARTGVNIQFGVTLHKLNHHKMDQVIDYTKQWGSRTDVRQVYDHKSKLQLRNQDENTFLALRKWYSFNYTPATFEPVNADGEYCWASRYQWFIRANGDIFPCCILAGDTQLGPIVADGDARLGDIGGHPDYTDTSFYRSRSKWIKEICRKRCIQRLDKINCIFNQHHPKRNFF